MRVLVLKRGFYPTADEYAKNLRQLGVDVTAVTIAPSGMVASDPGVPAVSLADNGTRGLLRALADLSQGCDIVHYLPGTGLELLPLVNRRAKHIFDYRSVSVTGRQWKDALVDFAKRFQPLLADCVVLSDALMHRRIGPLLPKRVRYMPVGYAGDVFTPCPGRPEGRRLVYHGVVAPFRRLGTLLGVMSRLPAEFTLTIVGGGDEGYLASLRRQTAELGLSDRITFTGHQPQTRIREQLGGAYLCVAYVPAHRCYQGQFPAKLLEALACQRPVLGTSTEATELFARGFGPDRLLLSRDDPGELADAILASGPYVDAFYAPERLAALARDVQSYTWHHLVRQHLLPIYEELLS